jgi:hypothetical protein
VVADNREAAGVITSSALLRRLSIRKGPSDGDGLAYRRLRRYVRRHHPVLYGVDMALRVGALAAWAWSVLDKRHHGWPGLVLFGLLAGVFVCFVLTVRRDPEGRL